MDKTKQVDGTFRPVQITREDFIKRWTEHFGQVFFLADSVAEFNELTTFKERVAQMAGAAWDRIPS